MAVIDHDPLSLAHTCMSIPDVLTPMPTGTSPQSCVSISTMLSTGAHFGSAKAGAAVMAVMAVIAASLMCTSYTFLKSAGSVSARLVSRVLRYAEWQSGHRASSMGGDVSNRRVYRIDPQSGHS
jgi:hypothetical protein